MQLLFSESVSFVSDWGCNVCQAASWSNMVIMEDCHCQLGYSPSSLTDAWQAMHAPSEIFFHSAITVWRGRSWLGPVPGANFNLNVLIICWQTYPVSCEPLASSHSSQDKCRHVSDSRHSALPIGGGAERVWGHRPPNDGVEGTMRSGPPNSDTSGPYKAYCFR